MGGTQPAAKQAPVNADGTARRRRLPRPSMVTVMAGLVLVLFGLAMGLGIPAHKGVGLAAVALPALGLGLAIARRQPGNRIALLLLGFGAVVAFYQDAAIYSVLDYHHHHGTLPLGPAAAVIASELWSTVFLALPLIILLFPDGRLRSWWRTTLWAYLGVCALITAALLAAGASLVSGAPIVVDGKGQLVNNSGPGGLLGLVYLILLLSVPVFWVLFVVRQVLSWRRADGERRAQLKWLMFGSAATVVGLAGTFLLQGISVLDNVMLAAGIFSLPVCISVAILKYHLYDIDRLISRTVSYVLITGLLIGVYAGVVTFTTHVLPVKSPVGVAVSTLVVAALFNPVRRRVQRVVDRRFNRARYDAEQTVAAFASRLKDEVDLDSIRDDLAGAVNRALEPAHISVWISQQAGDQRLSGAWSPARRD